MIDFATGLHTGSVYDDASLLPLLPGEGRCNCSVVAVKAHPTHITSFDIVPAEGATLRLNTTSRPQYAKCAALRFDSAVIVVRDPYAAAWAEYKRLVRWKELMTGRTPAAGNSSACRRALREQSAHSGGLLGSCFDAAHWRVHALRLARAWKHAWFHYGRFAAMPHTRTLQLGYEQLLAPASRLAALRKAVDFLGVRRSDDTLACAPTLAESPQVHRDRRAVERDGQYVTVHQAYPADGALVCEMWHVLRHRASRAGYAPFGEAKCARRDAAVSGT
jgi:hypothetical protein